jgi:hypothetical protein
VVSARADTGWADGNLTAQPTADRYAVAMYTIFKVMRPRTRTAHCESFTVRGAG